MIVPSIINKYCKMTKQIIKIIAIVEVVSCVLIGRYLLVRIKERLPPRKKQLTLKASRFAKEAWRGHRIEPPLQIGDNHKLRKGYMSFDSLQFNRLGHKTNPTGRVWKRVPPTSRTSTTSYVNSAEEMKQHESLTGTGSYFSV